MDNIKKNDDTLSFDLETLGAIELDDALLDAEVQGAGPGDIAPSTTTAMWVCNPAICCERR